MNNYEGEKNSQFGTKWIHKDGVAKKIKSIDLQTYVEMGWINGRLPNCKPNQLRWKDHEPDPHITKMQEWHLSVLQRDGYTCSECGAMKDNKRIDCHHIKEKEKFPEFMYDIDNGIVLCVSCHLRHHKKGNQFAAGNKNVLGKRWKLTKPRKSRSGTSVALL